MDIRKKKRPLYRKPIAWVISLVVLAILLLVSLEALGVTHFFAAKDTTGPTPAQKKEEDATNAAKKKTAVENSDTKADPYQTVDPSKANTSIDLTAKQESNGTVTVFTKLYGYSTGTCKLDVTNGTKTNSQTAEAVYQPEYATCAGFSVPISSLGSGSWSIKLSVTTAGVTKDKTITLEVK